jgi:biopolymer transport protein ExbD
MAIDPEGKHSKASEVQPDINVTPLIDVLLVLLIIFMVLTPLKQYRLESKIPEQTQSDVDVINPLVIVLGVEVDPQGRITGVKIQDAAPVSLEELTVKLKDAVQSLPSDRRTLFIRAAQNAIYGEIVQVIDIAKEAGASPIGLQIDDLPDS